MRNMIVALMLERSERAMNLEMLDGFFAVLICSPDVPPRQCGTVESE
jgi:hypothetical protein